MYPIISCYIQKRDLEKEYLNGLQKRRIDEKFAYIGERQARSWFSICESPEYLFYKKSKALLENSVEYLVSDYKEDVNLIALGPGNALKEKIIADYLRERHEVDLFFVDASREILNVAIENVIKDSNMLKEVFIADLKNFADIKEISQYVRSKYKRRSFFTLLGNTLGNYPQATIIKTIRDTMVPGDKVLIDINAKSKGPIKRSISQFNELMQAYNSPTAKERTFALLSEANIETTDGTIRIELGKDEFFPQIEVVKEFFCFDRSRVVSYCGEDVYFAQGERILVGYSNRYTLEPLEHENIFTLHGLRIIRYTKDATGKYYQVLCELA